LENPDQHNDPEARGVVSHSGGRREQCRGKDEGVPAPQDVGEGNPEDVPKSHRPDIELTIMLVGFQDG
jgi:hypothetical protein